MERNETIRFNVPKETFRLGFIGRKEYLERLHEEIAGDGHTVTGRAKVILVSGMAGVGKTTVVRHYLESYVKNPRTNVVWFSTERGEELTDQLRRLTTLVTVNSGMEEHETSGLNVTEQMHLVYQYLLQKPTIIVLDSAEDSLTSSESTLELDYAKLLPKPTTTISESFQPALIVTSRHRECAWLGFTIKTLTIPPFSLAESKDYLKSSLHDAVPVKDFDDHWKDVAEKVCGHLPAALEQAVSTILREVDRSFFSTTDYTLKDFLNNAKDPTYFFQTHPEPYSLTDKRLCKLWEPCINSLQGKLDTHIALYILEHLCCLQAKISRSFLGTMALEEGAVCERLDAVTRHPFEDQLDVLRQRSLVDFDLDATRINMNVVMQRAVLFNGRERMKYLLESVANFLSVQLIVTAGYENAVTLQGRTETRGTEERELWKLTVIGKLPWKAIDEIVETAGHVLDLGRRYNVDSICETLWFVENPNFVRAIMAWKMEKDTRAHYFPGPPKDDFQEPLFNKSYLF